MKNKIAGFIFILAGCAIVFGFTLFGAFGKHTDLADFFKGFTLAVGVAAGAAIVAILVKKAKDKAGTASS